MQQFVKDVTAFLNKKCRAHADEKTAEQFAAVLAGTAGGDGDTGIVVNERVGNVPIELAPPMHASMLKEIGWAVEDNEPYKFSHLVYLSKCFTLMDEDADEAPSLKGSAGKKQKRPKQRAPKEQQYCNFEDSLLEQAATLKFNYPIQLGGDGSLTERPTLETGEKLLPYRTVMVIPMDRVAGVVAQMEQAFGVPSQPLA